MTIKSESKILSILGCGSMGSALAKRLSHSHTLFLYDPHLEKLDALKKVGTACKTVKDAITQSDMVILAFKPKSLSESAAEIKAALDANPILVSILAGIRLDTLKEYFPDTAIVRMMPNLPILYGEGVTGIVSDLSKEENSELEKVFSSLGKLLWIDESRMDPLTALTGSGPAFFYAMMESMIEAGKKLGFSDDDSQVLVNQMVKGSLTLLDNLKEKPLDIIKKIAPPGGTTQAGLSIWEERQGTQIIIDTFMEAFNKAKSMGS